MGNTCFPSRCPDTTQYCFTIEEALGVACTGDLVFESGNSLISNFVETECGSMWSHVAMVYKDKIFEAVWSDDTHAQDDGTYERVVGCRLRDMREYFSKFQGNCIAIRHLLVKQPCIDQKAFQRHLEKKLRPVISKLLGKGYNREPLTIFLARVGWDILVPPDNGKSYFCSSLIAKCYQEVGLLDSTVSPYVFLPDNFSKAEFELSKPKDFQLSSAIGLTDNKAALIKLGSILPILLNNHNNNQKKRISKQLELII